MASTWEGSHGVVAFEGHTETVATQLRLLPTSPQILILPGIECYLQRDSGYAASNVPGLIRDTHHALLNRQEAAKAFLERSSSDNKRLVFMNGGAPSARAFCIRAIMLYHTNNDSREAERIFEHLVADGMHGLDKRWDDWKARGDHRLKSGLKSWPSETSVRMAERDSAAQHEDPITTAMKAAEALDRETESLQQSSDLDLTLTPTARSRSTSLPLYGYTDSFNDAAPFFVFGAQAGDSRDLARKPSIDMLLSPTSPTLSTTQTHHLANFLKDHGTISTPLPGLRGDASSSANVATWSSKTQELTPRTATFNLRSPDTSIFRESSLLEAANAGGLSPPPAHRRIRSLDRIFPMEPKYTDASSDDLASTPTAVATPTPRVETFGYDSKHAESWISFDDIPILVEDDDAVVKGATTVTMRPKRGTIVFGPVPKGRKRHTVQSTQVIKGTDAGTTGVNPNGFEPVFPMHEDLVVHLKDEKSDRVLDQAVQASQDRVRSLFKPLAVKHADAADEHVEDVSSPDNNEELKSGITSPSTSTDDYDPFDYTKFPTTLSRQAPRGSLVPIERPPTPDKTPTPSVSEKKNKFRECKIPPNQTAVSIQNKLRSLLDGLFPAEIQGHRQFHFSLLPELEDLWEPIFRQAEAGSSGTNSRRLDQILAIGSQREVRRDYVKSVTGKLERLGMKSSGLNRSGRLDIRYIVANAMQYWTSQPLASQRENPFTNPYLLATLLISQLETYLALHSEVRYLILEYPPEHLPTVISLQKLIGVDLMKVAQVISSHSTGSLPFTHIRGASIGSHGPSPRGSVLGSNDALLRRPKHAHSASMGEVQLSNANFLLTDCASESEIASFVSAISQILAAISDFYVTQPQPTPRKPSPRKAKPAALQSSFTAFPRKSIAIPPTPTSATSGATPKALSPTASTVPPSLSDSTRTARTGKSRATSRTRRKSRTRRGKQPLDAMSMYTFDPAEDSDYDIEEKRLMPIFLQKRKKGDGHKALKFLGLA